MVQIVWTRGILGAMVVLPRRQIAPLRNAPHSMKRRLPSPSTCGHLSFFFRNVRVRLITRLDHRYTVPPSTPPHTHVPDLVFHDTGSSDRCPRCR